MYWYLLAWKKFADFSGRARRKEYWYFILFNTLAYIGLSLVGGSLAKLNPTLGTAAVLLISIYYLAAIIPALAVSVRRLHDTNGSGFWLFINLVPIIGGLIFILVFMIKDSQPGENQYGPNLKMSPLR
jgi:uncharacterized membrane protein YhaH (DUF805 family)